MWKYPPFLKFLNDLDRFHLVDKVLVFDNNPDHKPDTGHLSDKIRFIKDSLHENIYVNPAWNYLVDCCNTEKICILNDDFIFDLRVFYRVAELLDDPTTGVIGTAPGDHPTITGQPPLTTGEINIIPHTHEHLWGFGYAMFMNKRHWDPIPEDMKVFCGDNWIFDGCLQKGLKNYIITNFLWRTPSSVTVNTLGTDFGPIDKALYMKYKAERTLEDRRMPPLRGAETRGF